MWGTLFRLSFVPSGNINGVLLIKGSVALRQYSYLCQGPYTTSTEYSQMAEITKEITVPPSMIPPLDESILKLEGEEKEFLHKAITYDDEELRARILEIQKE